MKFFNLLIVLVLCMALLLTLAKPLPLEDHEGVKEEEGGEIINIYDEELSSDDHYGFRRFLGQKRLIRGGHRKPMKCNKFPRICGAKGSPGPHCCKKRCVNVLTDRANCGRCGKNCKYSEICCHGKCVNPSFNREHCGGCNNRCTNGGFCAFGLCNYA